MNLNNPDNPYNLQEHEVKIAMELGIEFREIRIDPEHIRVETIRPIKFFYNKDGIRIEEYWPHGTKTYQLNAV